MRITASFFLKYSWLTLGIILLIGASLRIPGIFWGEIDRSRNAVVLEPDEFKHSDIARDYLQNWKQNPDYKPPYPIWNARSIGLQIACLGYLGEQLGWVETETYKLVLIGRFLSTAYALALIILIYYFSRFLFKSQKAALLAAALFAVFDLNITYSHYALPASSYIFWTHAAVFSISLWYIRMKRSEEPISLPYVLKYWQLGLAACISMAWSFGTKFDFIPFFIGGFAIGLLWVSGKNKFLTSLFAFIALCLTTGFFFLLSTGFRMGWIEVMYSLKTANGFNTDILERENHLLHNPIVFFLGVAAGVGLPVIVSAGYGIYQMLKNRRKKLWSRASLSGKWIFWLLFLLLEIGIRWMIDIPFIRRANFILPFVAVMAAYGFFQFFDSRKPAIRNLFLALLLLYTTGISVVSQYNFWNDTRYRAREFLQDIGEGKTFQYSVAAWIPGMPGNPQATPDSPDFWVIHESYYGRFWKYFTTPFKVPECCSEVYHCSSKEICLYYQALLREELNYKLIRIYPTIEYYPERLLFKGLFGSYETFLGDLRIYQKQAQE